ncbi:MAG: mandelate racemase/muconate lactonizing enzyme family protein [Lawsonibacter sp.]
MKITSIDIYDLLPDIANQGIAPICIRINTDEGVCGFGEVGTGYGNAHFAGVNIVRDLGPRILGRNPLDIEAIWEDLFRNTFWGMAGGTVIYAGMSAIDIALWDIKGKYFGVPVYQMLGGKCNERIRTYASQVQLGWGPVKTFLNDPADYAQSVRDAMAQGYTAVKVDPIGVTDQGCWIRASKDDTWKLRGAMPNKVLELACARVEAMRKAGGKDLDIIIENHAFTDTNTAIQLANALEPFGIYYMEEPVHPLNSRSMREIREKVNIPLASGERIFTRFGYRPYLEDRSLQVVQPDFCLVGGITEGKKVADMANIYDAFVQGHCCGGPISTAAALQVEAAIPNFIIHELHSGALKEHIRALCKYDHMPENGYYRVPELPGIGQELSEKAMANAKHMVIC